MRIDRHAAPVVDDAQPAAFLEGDFDEGGVAGHRLVHGIVDDFGKEVMKGVGVGPADVHSRTPPNGLQPLEHFDRGGIVGRFAGRSVARRRLALDGRRLAALGGRRAEKIVHVHFHILTNRAPRQTNMGGAGTKIEHPPAPGGVQACNRALALAQAGDAPVSKCCYIPVSSVAGRGCDVLVAHQRLADQEGFDAGPGEPLAVGVIGDAALGDHDLSARD